MTLKELLIIESNDSDNTFLYKLKDKFESESEGLDIEAKKKLFIKYYRTIISNAANAKKENGVLKAMRLKNILHNFTVDEEGHSYLDDIDFSRYNSNTLRMADGSTKNLKNATPEGQYPTSISKKIDNEHRKLSKHKVANPAIDKLGTLDLKSRIKKGL